MNTDIVNFSLNKFLPFFLVAFLSFSSLGINKFEPYIIFLLTCYIGRFHYRTGYAVAFCEKNNIPFDSDE